MKATNRTREKSKAKIDKLTKDKPEGYVNTLYRIIDSPVPEKELLAKNKKKSWRYGWDFEYDFVNISRDGTIGEFYLIQGLVVAVPKAPKDVYRRSKKIEEQYWEVELSPDEKLLERLKSVKNLAHLKP